MSRSPTVDAPWCGRRGITTRRWVAEQMIALLHWLRRLLIRWEIRDDIHEAFLALACAIICWRRLRRSRS
ncbi:hypothetical protein AAH979_18495 [Plantactinospora sp. ZYX-F-223]|uniref:hypothetical protein n=1 Tax=Plantactinospora sp. ZYX-F-223 TaxID=3144103 RepID=UPI0031FDD7BE